MAFQLIWSLDGKHVHTFALNQSASNYFCALHIRLVLYTYVLFLQSQKKKKKVKSTNWCLGWNTTCRSCGFCSSCPVFSFSCVNRPAGSPAGPGPSPAMASRLQASPGDIGYRKTERWPVRCLVGSSGYIHSVFFLHFLQVQVGEDPNQSLICFRREVSEPQQKRAPSPPPAWHEEIIPREFPVFHFVLFCLKDWAPTPRIY